MTIDCNMLRFLDNHSNTNTNPNENYARELLELYTIGKGPQIGPGDYSNYTEDDVASAARYLLVGKLENIEVVLAIPTVNTKLLIMTLTINNFLIILIMLLYQIMKKMNMKITSI